MKIAQGNAFGERNKKFAYVDAIQMVLYGDQDFINKDGIRVCPAENILKNLI